MNYIHKYINKQSSYCIWIQVVCVKLHTKIPYRKWFMIRVGLRREENYGVLENLVFPGSSSHLPRIILYLCVNFCLGNRIFYVYNHNCICVYFSKEKINIYCGFWDRNNCLNGKCLEMCWNRNFESLIVN